ncbi:hypothetical protein AGRO_3674 [Agrobacterium sp. ATCC 31749]|uniref:hypothetical protein n=1 Tax=unclassified Agrobacterium TaxID=2632611 RepID=UPI00020DB73F|nr:MULTISPECIES: hypothetical protein [unclassified Agrobacterium]EGL63605.1 hypothetical protein AGRO_3674 [Agrobacterium sp. ATCC 31749]QKW97083.1 hypothetical protein GSF67_08275 [Agrobacterium sp. CGMCC 11546]
MALVEITKTTSVNPNLVQSVQCSYDASCVVVRMHDGREHNVQPVHHETAWEAYDRIRASLGYEVQS